MCGIIGYLGIKKASPILLAGLNRLEYRGYDSAGISTVETDGIHVVKDQGRVKNLESIPEINTLEGVEVLRLGEVTNRGSGKVNTNITLKLTKKQCMTVSSFAESGFIVALWSKSDPTNQQQHR